MDSPARWLEVSMTVSGELAEAVAEVLGRFANNGVVIESGVVYKDASDEGTPVDPVRIFGYLIADEKLEETRQRLAEALWHLGQIQALPEVQYRAIADEDWMAAWKKHYRPIPIGQRLLILPAWIKKEQTGRIAVRIDPSMAFGTGTHPTTQLCLEVVEEYTRPGMDVLDVGCGSGILAIAALKLGAHHALAVDTDRAAIRATRENAVANGVEEKIKVGVGSVSEVRNGDFSLRQAPLVLANILAPVIIRLFDSGLAALVEPGGLLALSGILAEQSQEVEAAASRQGLSFIERKQSGDWIALVFRR
ncbi:MAG: 50S ribosomal protein L11 methyltransferase [Anaerolineaceae bacterium]|nr:50S ribosomal protein L11 methyltransferase [Anaerolineaceae bacterium]